MTATRGGARDQHPLAYDPGVGTGDQSSRKLSLREATSMTVGDVMIQRPKTVPGDVTVADVRAAFDSPAVRTVLLADSDRFIGAIERDGLPGEAADVELAERYVEPRPTTVTPDTPMSVAVEMLERRGEPRLIVLDADGVTLRGLLCANAEGTRFCIR